MRLLATSAQILFRIFLVFRKTVSILCFKNQRMVRFQTKTEIFIPVLLVSTIRLSASFLIASADRISAPADSLIVAPRERCGQNQAGAQRFSLRHWRERKSKKIVDIFSPRIFAKKAKEHEKGISPLLTYIRIGRGEIEIRLRTSGDLHRR